MSNKILFNKGNEWIKGKYKIIPSKFSYIRMIVPDEKANMEWYQPLSCLDSMPDKQNKEYKEYAPHIHLANIDLNNEKEIEGFVNRWGLLGLWKVGDYKNISLLEAGFFINEPKKDKGYLEKGSNYSEWYEYNTPNGNKLNCEPLPVFIQAAKGIQGLMNKIKKFQNKTEYKPALLSELISAFDLFSINLTPRYDNKLNKWSFGWEYTSLYSAIHLLIYLDLVKGNKYKECENEKCNNTFIPTNSLRDYCSIKCRQNQNTRDTGKRKGTTKQLWNVKYKKSNLSKMDITKEIIKEIKKRNLGKATWDSVERWINEAKREEKNNSK